MDRGLVFALMGVLGLAGLGAWAPVFFLGAGGFGVVLALSADLGVILCAWAIITRARRGLLPKERWFALGFVALVFGLLSSPLWWPGVTAARFGLTVVGLLPVPGFDLIFDVDAHPHLRAKTHLFRAEELTPYLEQRPEVIVLGVGWSSAVKVAPELHRLGVAVEALESGAALARWRALREQGRRVILLLHSTC